jgi:hypothetical protein
MGKKFEEIFIGVKVNFFGIGVLLNWNTDQDLCTGFSGLPLADVDGGFVFAKITKLAYGSRQVGSSYYVLYLLKLKNKFMK